MTSPISTRIEQSTGLIIIDNPPVNAASQAVREGIWQAINQLEADVDVKVIAIYGAGRTFVAGADITEFGKPPKPPALPDLCNRVEASTKPVVCVLHGTTLGGGLELAMGAHARIGVSGLKVGLPEVALGLLPGAGGTQRAPRLMGADAALELMTSGRHMVAEEALEKGLLDRLEEGTPEDIALKAAKWVLDGDLHTRRTGEIEMQPEPEVLLAWRTKLEKASPHLISPLKCVDCVELATGPIEHGMKVERATFMECLTTPQSKGLIHAFMAERVVAKVPEAKVPPRDIDAVGIIGGGTMGSGIGTAALMSGLTLTLVEQTEEGVAKAKATIFGNLEGGVKRGKLSESAFEDAKSRLTVTTKIEDLADADLIIEAVFEDMEVKKAIFRQLDEIAKAGAVLASNTSYLNVNDIAAATKRPEDVLGLHFFSPAHIMRLLEVIVAEKTSLEVAATGFALGKRLRKIAVRSEVCDGFIGNRVLAHYARCADYLVMAGASPQQVDSALEAFGFAMGPFAVGDLAGLDIGWANRKRQNRPESELAGKVADRICEQGWFGRKTGQGYYIYDGKTRLPNPEVTNIIEAERAKRGITPRSFTDDEIVARYMTAMILEATRVVEDGVALRPADVDAVFLFGYGFPRFRGGPLHYADTIGAKELVARAESYAVENAEYWKVPDLLRQMAAEGTGFADINKR